MILRKKMKKKVKNNGEEHRSTGASSRRVQEGARGYRRVQGKVFNNKKREFWGRPVQEAVVLMNPLRMSRILWGPSPYSAAAGAAGAGAGAGAGRVREN